MDDRDYAWAQKIRLREMSAEFHQAVIIPAMRAMMGRLQRHGEEKPSAHGDATHDVLGKDGE